MCAKTMRTMIRRRVLCNSVEESDSKGQWIFIPYVLYFKSLLRCSMYILACMQRMLAILMTDTGSFFHGHCLQYSTINVTVILLN